MKLEGQVDAIVFAGGIGEKGQSLRTAIVEKCKCLGFELDSEKNSKLIEHVVQDIGKHGSKHRVLVCQTDEQVRETVPSGTEFWLTQRNSLKWQDRVRCRPKNIYISSRNSSQIKLVDRPGNERCNIYYKP